MSVDPPLSDHPEASEEGEEGQEETARSSGVRIQEERAGGADPQAAVARRQHALTQWSVTENNHVFQNSVFIFTEAISEIFFFECLLFIFKSTSILIDFFLFDYV